MNNLKASMKKLLGNKNTVTILGVLLCLVILAIGYNYRINSKVELVQVPYAVETIQPRTYIKDSMVGIMNVPKSFLVGNYYTQKQNIVGKYSNYNTIIAKGSLFYTDLVTSKEDLPDSAFQDVPEGYTVISPTIYIFFF